jgi:hypothetical protein
MFRKTTTSNRITNKIKGEKNEHHSKAIIATDAEITRHLQDDVGMVTNHGMGIAKIMATSQDMETASTTKIILEKTTRDTKMRMTIVKTTITTRRKTRTTRIRTITTTTKTATTKTKKTTTTKTATATTTKTTNNSNSNNN